MLASKDKIINDLQKHLHVSEKILDISGTPVMVSGTFETEILGSKTTKTGHLIATTDRIIFYSKKLTGFEMESFPYKNISSLEQGKNMMGSNLKIIASGNTAYLKWINDANALRIFLSKAQELMSNKSSSSTVQEPGVIGIPEQIKKLAELRDSGILTEDEFQSKKQELLDRL